MKLLLQRIGFNQTHTAGVLYIDGRHCCDTIEPIARVLHSAEDKVDGKTAIPAGCYAVELTYSPKFGQQLPEIKGVPYFSGIRIHHGNTVADTSGCVLVGIRSKCGKLICSRIKLIEIVQHIRAALGRNEKITIDIV